MSPALRGARILVTRPAAQADKLCDLISQHGGSPIRFPTLEIIPVRPESAELDQAVDSDWLVFTSANAVDFAIKAFGGKMPALRNFKVAAVGEATASALRQAGCAVDCVPARDFSSEGLLAEPALAAVEGCKCVIVRGVGGREKLADGLRARGARVAYLEVYRRKCPEQDNRELCLALAEQRLAALTITSVEALHNLLAMLGSDALDALQLVLLVAASERIRAEAEQLGFKRIAVSKQPTDAAILETLTTLLNEEHSGRNN